MSRILAFPTAPGAPFIHPDTIRDNEAVAKRRENLARELTPAQLAARLAYQTHKQEPTPNAYGVHVGDLFSLSYGYDMTIVEFFEVVALKGKATAIVREIAGEIVDGDGWSGNTRPVRGQYISEAAACRTSGKPYVVSLTAPGYKGRHLSPTTDDALHHYNHLD
jgi:hypothetical protein